MSQFGTLQQLIEYLNSNRAIFERERTSKRYMERIMSMLTHENMEILEREFELYPSGLELPTFIYLMKRLYTPENELSKYYFVSDLIKFFQAIDVNGDGHLEWSEFTEYIIENIRRIEKPVTNSVFKENEVISSAYSKISNEYKITKIIDAGTPNCIKKVVYCDSKYYLQEMDSSTIYVYDDKFSRTDSFTPSSATIIDFSFDKTRIVFGCIQESTLLFCNVKSQGIFKHYNACDKLKNHHKIQYLHKHQYWAVLSKEGEMRLCTVEYRSRTHVNYHVVESVKPHQQFITDICEVEEHMLIATSAMDGCIKMYSPSMKKMMCMEHTNDQTNSALNKKYKKGLLGLDCTKEFGNYMLSYSFSGAVAIYSLDISLLKGFIGKYSEHGGNIITAKFLKSFPYVLSFDEKLCMRIWDFRTFTTVQIINCEKNFMKPTRLEIIPDLSQLLVCQKKITQFRTPSLEKKSKELNEFHSIFDFKICSTTNNIFLFTSNDVRIYNYVTGNLQQIFTKLNESSFETNITAAQFGFKSSRFFLGDAGGSVREYCSQTGQYIRDISPEDHYQNKAIVSILFIREHSILIVCTLDGRILIYARKGDGSYQTIRDLRETHYELICAAASPRYSLLATGGEDGTVNLWNLERFSIQGLFLFKNKVIGVTFSPIYPLLIVAQCSGCINVFYVKPHSVKNRCIFRLLHNIQPTATLNGLPNTATLNMTANTLNSHPNTIHYNDTFTKQTTNKSNNNSITTPITSVSCELVLNPYLKKGLFLTQNVGGAHHMLLTVGDMNGVITIYNLNPLLNQYNIEENHQIASFKNTIKCEVHSLRQSLASERKKILNYSNEGADIIDLKAIINVVHINAHKEQIDKVLLVRENSIVLSTSADKKLKLHNLEGELNGCIDFFTFKKLNWKVAEMNFHKKLQSIEMTIYSIKLIENINLNTKEEEFITINLLINEYMNQEDKDNYLKWIALLQRARKNKKKKIICSEAEDELDVRDQITQYIESNKQTKENKEFNCVYDQLVKKIKGYLQVEKDAEKTENIAPSMHHHTNHTAYNTFNQKTQSKFINLSNHLEFVVKTVKKKKKISNLLFKSIPQIKRNLELIQKQNRQRKYVK